MRFLIELEVEPDYESIEGLTKEDCEDIEQTVYDGLASVDAEQGIAAVLHSYYAAEVEKVTVLVVQKACTHRIVKRRHELADNF